MNKSILFIDLEGSASDFEVVDVGEKAKKLVKLSSRTELLVMYNLTHVTLTKHLMQNMKRLMEHATLVSRRVLFGVDPRYTELVRQIMTALDLNANTRYADNYTQALNLIADDAEWVERRRAKTPVATDGPDRRLDPAKVAPTAELLDKMDRLSGS